MPGQLTLANVCRVKTHETLGKSGAPARTRTWDQLIKSQLLYQLSYRGNQKLQGRGLCHKPTAGRKFKLERARRQSVLQPQIFCVRHPHRLFHRRALSGGVNAIARDGRPGAVQHPDGVSAVFIARLQAG